MNTLKPFEKEPFGKDEEEDDSCEDEDREYEDGDDIDLNDDDIWDDSVLIKMYEASQKEINNELTKRFTGRTAEEVADESSSRDNAETAAAVAASSTENGGEGSDGIESSPPNNTSNNNDGKNSTSVTNGVSTANGSKKKQFVKSNKLTVKSKICPSLNNSNRHQPTLQLSKPMYTWKEGAFCQATYLEDGVDYEAKIIAINPTDQTCTIRYIGYENEEYRALIELKPSGGERVRKLQIDMAIQDGYSGGGGATSTKDSINDFKTYDKAPLSDGSNGGHKLQAVPELSLIPNQMQPQTQQHSLRSHNQHHQQYHQHHLPPPPQVPQPGLMPTSANPAPSNNPNRIIPPPPPFLNQAGGSVAPEGVSAGAALLHAITNGPSTSSSCSMRDLPTEDDDDVLASMLMSWYMTGYHTGYYQARKDLMK